MALRRYVLLFADAWFLLNQRRHNYCLDLEWGKDVEMCGEQKGDKNRRVVTALRERDHWSQLFTERSSSVFSLALDYTSAIFKAYLFLTSRLIMETGTLLCEV